MKNSLVSISFVSLFLLGCANGPSSGNSPQEMFEHLIASPVPAEVTQLQGVGDTWQGYSLWLRFNAPDAFIRTLTENGYAAVPCNKEMFVLSPGYDLFDPPWNPSVTQCYEGQIFNDWGNGFHTLGIDSQTDTVYFYGSAP